MDFKQLRSFVAIVDCQNFSKAADKLNFSQSSVSTHLLQLEKELGIKLLNRTTKTIEVTDAGWRVYRYANQILELADCVHQVCFNRTNRVIRIAAATIPATYILPGVLQQYKTLCPNDCVKIKELDHRSVVEGVLDGRFDVGLTEQMVHRDGLICASLCHNRPVLITPATEPYLQMKQTASAPELLKEPVILWEKDFDFISNQLGIESENLNIAARVNDYETVKNMVSGGMGISVLPEVAVRDYINAHRLLAFDLHQSGQTESIYLVYPDDCTSKNRIWNFIDYLLESKELPFC